MSDEGAKEESEEEQHMTWNKDKAEPHKEDRPTTTSDASSCLRSLVSHRSLLLIRLDNQLVPICQPPLGFSTSFPYLHNLHKTCNLLSNWPTKHTNAFDIKPQLLSPP